MTREARTRRVALREAERTAERLFRAVEERGLIRPGRTEKQVSVAIHALAQELFDTTTYWHKRVVRAGRNTICPYREDPPDLTIAADDIVFVDLGPVFARHEADFGATYVLGDDPEKHRIAAGVEQAWRRAKHFFDSNPELTGARLYAHMCDLAHEGGWDYGAEHCGHLVGEFPHEELHGDEVENYIHPDNHAPLRAPDAHGFPREWIIEAHFVDRRRGFGAFVERLLSVD